MKKLLLLFLIAFAYSCNWPGDESAKKTTTEQDAIVYKSKLTDKEKKEHKDRIDCNWNMKPEHFNKKKRDSEFNIGTDEAPIKAKRGTKPPAGTEPPPTTTSNTGGVIYLNFWGKTVSGTMWNVYGAFTVGHSGFAQPEIDLIKLSVAAHYSPWQVTITTDEQVYNNAPGGRKIEICLTEDYAWYGSNAGGVAYVGSFFNTSGPGFVFTTLLKYSVHNIAEAAAHEAGHTLGLRHAVDCANGVITNQYSAGKTMGNSYMVSMGVFGKHITVGCVDVDEPAKLTAVLGLK